MKTTNQHILVYFALCLTIVAAVSVDKVTLLRPKRIKQTLDNTPDDELTDAALALKQQRAEEREYYRWHLKGSKKIIPMEEQFRDCLKSFWEEFVANATERNRCLLAFGHVLTDEKKDQESTEEVEERKVLFDKATKAYNEIVTNFSQEELDFHRMTKNVTELQAEDTRGFRDSEIWKRQEDSVEKNLEASYDPTDASPEAFRIFKDKERSLEAFSDNIAAHQKHLDAELKEAKAAAKDELARHKKMAQQLRHATVKFKNYRAQHEAEEADKKPKTKTQKSVKSSAHRQFHVIAIAAIAMIALAY